MRAPELPLNETDRQAAVDRYQLLDTPPEAAYDDITDLMAYVCNAPVSLITFLDHDRNFLKSHHGLPFNESPRDISFCGHTINSEEEITIIEDARKDERFFDNPLVTDFQAIFYAGVSLVDPQGYKLGTLCVYDHEARKLTPEQKNALIKMSKQVVRLFELHLQNSQLRELANTLATRNHDLKNFAQKVSHDLKSPLNDIISACRLINRADKENLSLDSVGFLDYIQNCSFSLADYVDGILTYYKHEDLKTAKRAVTRMDQLISQLNTLIPQDENIRIDFERSIESLVVNKSALLQIMLNLITNGIKYNAKKKKSIRVKVFEDESFYHFEITDNGEGVPEEHYEDIFDLFTTLSDTDSNGVKSTGIGLAIVKKLVENMGGSISVNSDIGIGSQFLFRLEKDHSEDANFIQMEPDSDMIASKKGTA